jgi:hypothetical protein
MIGRALPMNRKVERALHDEAWRRLITLKTAKDYYKLNVSSEEISAAIQQQPFFVENGKFSPEKYNYFVSSFLPALNATEAQFIAALQDEMLLNKMKFVVNQTLWIAPLDMQRMFHQFYDTFLVTHAYLSTNDIADKVKITEVDAEKFYNSHSNLFLIPAKRKVQYVYFPHELYLDEDSVTQEEIENYYNEHISEFTISSTDQWSDVTVPLYMMDIEIRNELARQRAMDAACDAADAFAVLITPDRDGNAKSFEEAAKTNSLKTITTDFFAVNEPVKGVDAKAFHKTVFELKLNNPEEYFSHPLAGKNGYYVVALLESTDPVIPPFEKNREVAFSKAREYALDQEAEQKMKSLKDEFANKATISTNTFRQIAQKYGCSVTTLDPFSVKGIVEKEDTPQDFYTIMQSVLKLNSGECSDVFPYKAGYALTYVESRAPAEQSILNAVRGDFIRHIKARMESLLCVEWQKYMLASAKFEDFNPLTQQAITASEEESEKDTDSEKPHSEEEAE